MHCGLCDDPGKQQGETLVRRQSRHDIPIIDGYLCDCPCASVLRPVDTDFQMGALQLPTEGGYGQRNTEKPRSPPVGMEMNLEKKKEGSLSD